MAGRRDLQGSEASGVSLSSSLATEMKSTLQLADKLEDEANESPEFLLRRLLSTKSAISTSSSLAQTQEAAVGQICPFREIGTGSVGKVFEQPGTPWAFKLPLIDGTDKLWNHYIMNLRIQQSLDSLGPIAGDIEVPRAAWFANEQSEFWDENLKLFPTDPTFPRRRRDVLCMERVYPLPQTIRHALIDVFCSPDIADTIKDSKSNKDCLIHLYLGRKRFGSSRRFFSLRNYKLHVDQIQSLELEAESYASTMASALAVLHWHTRIDAMDIEFVLGSTPLDRNCIRRALPLHDIKQLEPGSSTFEHTTNSSPNFRKRSVCLWIIDFDACSSITMDSAGVEKAVKAFFETAAYCPRPSPGDEYPTCSIHPRCP
ncbi:unnamed protein product [Penicillium nalgiovense]|nr:unnamed protein product [Penicillium nalgiovense]